MLKVFIVQNVPLHKANYSAAYTAVLCVCVCVCVCVCPLNLSVYPADRILRYRNVIYLKIISASKVAVP